MSKMPDFIPDDLPDFILFAVAGVDPSVLLADEIPDGPGKAELLDGARGLAIQSALNCPAPLAVAGLRALADSIERADQAQRAARN